MQHNIGGKANAKNFTGWTSLFLASQNGHREVVRVLIDKGADVNARMIDGTTALSVARAKGHSDIVSLLLNAGAQ